MDIPIADDIPIVSKLAKLQEQEKLASMDTTQQVEYHKNKRLEKVSKVIDDSADNLETHFVENPFIKMRERAAQRDLDSKKMMGQTQLTTADLESQARDNDVYIL